MNECIVELREEESEREIKERSTKQANEKCAAVYSSVVGLISLLLYCLVCCWKLCRFIAGSESDTVCVPKGENK